MGETAAIFQALGSFLFRFTVQPWRDKMAFLSTKCGLVSGLEFESGTWREGHILQIFSGAVALLSRLKALVTSISKLASQFSFSNYLRRAWIACLIPAVYPRQS